MRTSCWSRCGGSSSGGKVCGERLLRAARLALAAPRADAGDRTARRRRRHRPGRHRPRRGARRGVFDDRAARRGRTGGGIGLGFRAPRRSSRPPRQASRRTPLLSRPRSAGRPRRSRGGAPAPHRPRRGGRCRRPPGEPAGRRRSSVGGARDHGRDGSGDVAAHAGGGRQRRRHQPAEPGSQPRGARDRPPGGGRSGRAAGVAGTPRHRSTRRQRGTRTGVCRLLRRGAASCSNRRSSGRWQRARWERGCGST